jgi:hypothetical protein
MKRPEELSHMLTEMYNDTKDGKIHWNISVQTTENNEVSEKPVEVEDGVSWTIDECYVSYYCKYKGQDFLMITYEMIKALAERYGTRVIESEIVGLTPAKALIDCAEFYLKAKDFDCKKQVMEYHLIDME